MVALLAAAWLTSPRWRRRCSSRPSAFAIGETMYAPILNPWTAALALRLVGTTGVFTRPRPGSRPPARLLASVARAGLSSVFLGLHPSSRLVAVGAAWQLRNLLNRVRHVERVAAPPASSATP